MKTDTYSQLSFLRDNFSKVSLESQPLWHPLGFVSCIVREEGRTYTTRLHYWPKYERRTKSPNWPIHTHAYDLSSLILDGRIYDIQYKLVAGSGYAIYSVEYFGESSTINYTNEKASIAKVTDGVHVAGEEYSIPIGSFHETRVPMDECAVSLVVLSNFSDRRPLVLGRGEGQRYRYDRAAFDKTIFWTRMGEVIRKFSC